MQKRLMQRNESVFSVILYQYDVPISYGNSRNVCPEGIFIESGPNKLTDKNSLKIGFNHDLNGQMTTHFLPVTFVHQNNNGIGLKFVPGINDNDTFTHALLGYISRNHKVSPDEPKRKIA